MFCGVGGKIQQNVVVHGIGPSVCTIWRCSGTGDGRHCCDIQIVEGHVEVLPVSFALSVINLAYCGVLVGDMVIGHWT